MITNKIKKNKILNKTSYTVTGFLLIILISVPLAKNLSKRYYVNKEIRALENEISELENKNTKLEELMEYLESNEFVEEQARLKLGLKRNGEEAVIIEGLKDTNQDSANPNYLIKGINNEKKGNNASKWIKYFFNSHELRIF